MLAEARAETPGTSLRSAAWFYGTALAVALHFSIDYLTLTSPMIGFDPYVRGLAPAPFRYRVLVAWIYHGFSAAMDGHQLPRLNAPFDSQEGWFLVLLSTASLLLTVFATGRAIRGVARATGYRWLSLLILPMAYFSYILPPHRALFYPYDLPALAFFSVLVWLALDANYLWFAVVFLPAEINRETVVYTLALFLLLQAGLQPWKKLLPYLAGLGAVYLAIKYGLYVALRQSCEGCGRLAISQIRYNLHQLANPIFWIAIFSVFGYAWIALIPLWRYIQPRLRWSFAALLFLWSVPLLFIGILRELRLFAELSPLLLVLLADGLVGLFGRRSAMSPAEAAEASTATGPALT